MLLKTHILLQTKHIGSQRIITGDFRRVMGYIVPLIDYATCYAQAWRIFDID